MNGTRAAFARPSSESVRHELARRTLLGFTTWTKPDYQTNWHHRVVCEKLDRLVRGEITRLMVFMPPRHGKSELVSRRLPAYALGHNPDEQIISCAYNAPIASSFNRDVQRIIDDPTQRYSSVFPQTRLYGKNNRTLVNGAWLRNSDIFEVTGRKGFYISAGIRGGITGRGCTLGIVDDPIKNREDADSLTFRDSVWEWWQSTFYTRLEKNARILITLTRWHEDDLAGRLLQLANNDPDADQWEVLSFPAVREETAHELDARPVGAALWPGKYDTASLRAKRANVGSREWAALYQQRPSPDEGGIFRREWFRYWHRDKIDPQVLVLDKGEERPKRILGPKLFRFCTVDVAAGMKQQNDFTAISTWGLTPERDLVLLDVLRAKMEGPDQVAAIRRVFRRWRPAFVGVEAVAYQLTLVQTLLREGIPARALHPDRDKVSRAHTAAVRMEGSTVFFPISAPWLSDFEHELLTFPNGTHDDQVDTLSYAAAYVALEWAKPGNISPGALTDGLARPSPIMGAT
jgi:predicted phage terminase large subunit-like protein